MAPVEAALKSPSIPPFIQRGKFRSRTLTPLWKRVEGEILGGVRGELCRELLGQDTSGPLLDSGNMHMLRIDSEYSR
jgi:hypothetical protein